MFDHLRYLSDLPAYYFRLEVNWSHSQCTVDGQKHTLVDVVRREHIHTHSTHTEWLLNKKYKVKTTSTPWTAPHVWRVNGPVKNSHVRFRENYISENKHGTPKMKVWKMMFLLSNKWFSGSILAFRGVLVRSCKMAFWKLLRGQNPYNLFTHVVMMKQNTNKSWGCTNTPWIYYIIWPNYHISPRFPWNKEISSTFHHHLGWENSCFRSRANLTRYNSILKWSKVTSYIRNSQHSPDISPTDICWGLTNIRRIMFFWKKTGGICNYSLYLQTKSIIYPISSMGLVCLPTSYHKKQLFM